MSPQQRAARAVEYVRPYLQVHGWSTRDLERRIAEEVAEAEVAAAAHILLEVTRSRVERHEEERTVAA
jgi:hypothetical protein